MTYLDQVSCHVLSPPAFLLLRMCVKLENYRLACLTLCVGLTSFGLSALSELKQSHQYLIPAELVTHLTRVGTTWAE
jgi:hypothetical protein